MLDMLNMPYCFFRASQAVGLSGFSQPPKIELPVYSLRSSLGQLKSNRSSASLSEASADALDRFAAMLLTIQYPPATGVMTQVCFPRRTNSQRLMFPFFQTPCLPCGRVCFLPRPLSYHGAHLPTGHHSLPLSCFSFLVPPCQSFVTFTMS